MKKLLFLLAMLLLIPTAIVVAKDATLINFITGDRVPVEVNSQEAQQYFADDYVLETSYGYVENDGEMLGYSVVSDYYVYLSQSMSSSQTTVPVTTMDTQDDHTLTMAEIGSKVFLTIDPDDDDYKELVLCTGISGTSWTGCTRGLAFYGTSTAAVSANQKTHNSGAIVIMANTHYVYEEFMDKDTAETIGGVKTFSSYPQIETYVAPTADEEFVPKKYADDLSAQGVATTTEDVFGGSYLGTRTEMASSTWDANMPTVLQTQYSTSSPDVRGVNVVVSENDGYIDSDWLRLSDDLAFSGTNTHSGENTFSATTTMATTTIDKITLTATSTDYMATQSKGYIDSRNTLRKDYDNTAYSVLLEPTGTTYILDKLHIVNVPMEANDKLKIQLNSNCSGNCSAGNFGSRLQIGDGTSTSTIAYVVANSATLKWEAEIINKNSTSANWLNYKVYKGTDIVSNSWVNATTFDTTGNLYFELRGYNDAQGENYMNTTFFEVELIKY